ncbi:hypothetical protein EDD90_8498 [Streptomyces sp. Ag109_O5-1]|nr:hypothetical protein EDD90_8498 [Streptomyces sp. Ag109_O5-1]
MAGGCGAVLGGVVGRGGAVGTGNVRMCGLHALPDSGVPMVVGKSLRGRSGRLGPATPVPPAVVSAEGVDVVHGRATDGRDGCGAPSAPRRSSDDDSGSDSAEARGGRNDPVASDAPSGRRTDGPGPYGSRNGGATRPDSRPGAAGGTARPAPRPDSAAGATRPASRPEPADGPKRPDSPPEDTGGTPRPASRPEPTDGPKRPDSPPEDADGPTRPVPPLKDTGGTARPVPRAEGDGGVSGKRADEGGAVVVDWDGGPWGGRRLG